MAENRERSGKTKILVVDDHPIMRAGLVQLIGQEEDLVVCGQAEDAHAALEAARKDQPDVAIVDISLKESSGIALIKDLRARWPGVLILVLSMHDETFYAERALRAGANGYVTKAEASAKVIEGIRKILSGEVYVSEKLASKMLSGLVGGGAGAATLPMDRLTDREFEVLELIGQGLQGREIAQQLHLSVKTVDAHREHIKRKLGLGSATELLTYAVQWVQFDRGS